MSRMLGLVLILGLAACAHGPEAASGGRALPLANPGFESGGGAFGDNPGVARHWQNTDGKPYPGWYAIDRDVFHSGGASQRMTYVPGLSDPHGTVWQFTPEGSVTSGRRYRASVWTRTEGVTGASEKWGWLHLTLRFFGGTHDSPFPLLGEFKAPPTEHINHDWEEVSVEAVAPEGASFIQILVHLHTEAGTYWYDDASVIEVQ